MKYFTLIFLTIISLSTSCKDAKKTKPTEEKTATKILASTNTHQITVIKKIPAGGYIYLKVAEKDKEYWMAIPGREVKIGDTYYYDGGMEMRKFESKSLKRTFDSVIFAQGIRDKKEGAKDAKKRSINRGINKGESNVVNVTKAPNGIRIAELFENPKAYQNKQVIIKGQVVKVNNGIMGLNFMHLQDGTKGNSKYDVTITSKEEFKIGKVVTIKGTVVLNKDFGSGYVYDVLIEKAVIL